MGINKEEKLNVSCSWSISFDISFEILHCLQVSVWTELSGLGNITALDCAES